MHALAQLIADARTANPRLTYPMIARLAGVTSSAVGNWSNTKAEQLTHLPLPESILGLARALGMHPEQVLLAAGHATGIPTRLPDGFAAQLPEGVDELPVELRDQLLHLLRVLTEACTQTAKSAAASS